MLVDVETSSRCVLAALDMLSREVRHLTLPSDQARRLGVLLDMARQHAAEVVSTAPAVATRPTPFNGAPAMENAASIAGSLSSEASAAWIACAALRGATTAADVQHCRIQLEAIEEGAKYPRIRELCRQALATE